jgi:hypothetical protein
MTDLDLIYGTKPTTPSPTGSAEQKRATVPPLTSPPSPTKKSNKTEILTSKNASNKASKQVSSEGNKEVNIEESILASLQTTALKANTFRYTQEELDFIRDVVYEADVNYKTKLDKNDVARIGLEWLIVDWKVNKETSLLARILTHKKTRK